MASRTPLTLIALTLTSFACEPVEPSIPQPRDCAEPGGSTEEPSGNCIAPAGPELASGAWELQLGDVWTEGACLDLHDAAYEIAGTTLPLELELMGDSGLRMDLDGLRMLGELEGSSLWAEGQMGMETVVVTCETDDEPVPGGVPCPANPPEPDHGDEDRGDDDGDREDREDRDEDYGDYESSVFAGVHGDVLSPVRFVGTLTIDLVGGRYDCVIGGDFNAQFTGDDFGDEDRPVTSGDDHGNDSGEDSGDGTVLL